MARTGPITTARSGPTPHAQTSEPPGRPQRNTNPTDTAADTTDQINRWIEAKTEDNQVVALSVESFSSHFAARTSANIAQENGGSASGPL